MNWNPLRKFSSLQRPELDSSTQNANEALEKLVAEFDSAENVTKSLHQAAKKLPDHILCMGKFENKLTDDLSTSNLFADQDDYMRSIIEDYHSFAFVSNTIGDEYVVGIQKNLIEPLKQLKQAFGELRSAIRLHDSIQLDVIKFQRKVASYGDREKTGANLVKLQDSKQALAASQREFAKRTQILVNDLSKFLTGSMEMLQPLLEGFIAAEVAWVRACEKSMETKSNLIAASQSHTQQDRVKNIEETFKRMSALSICSESK